MELALQLQPSSDMPLYQQVSEQIRGAILTGRLRSHQRLPASRQLAQSLNVSRTTVTESYDLLISEGYLETRKGAGTFVCAQIPDDLLHAPPAVLASAKSPESKQIPLPRLSAYGHRLQKTADRTFPIEMELSFRYGIPAVDLFPLPLWRKLQNRYRTAAENGSKTQHWMNYSDEPMGYAPLREQIADTLGQARAVSCSPDQVLITNGTQQALSLIMQIMIEPGDAIALEDPGYLSARHIFSSSGAALLPVAVDSEGLKVDELDRLTTRSNTNTAPKLVYVTPSHQFPTGVLMSLSRRLALLQWASRHNALIIEDDYDSEFRYSGRPVPALQGLDSSDRVLYVGTFSKTMFPGLRLGYVVLPKPLVSIFKRAKWMSCRQTSLLDQQALTDFIQAGHLAKHIRRMRSIYEGRRQRLIKELNALTKQQSAAKAIVLGDAAGLHIMARLPTQRSNEDVVKQAKQQGVSLFSAAQNYWNASDRAGTEPPPGQGEFIFGFGDISESKISQAIAQIESTLLTYPPLSPSPLRPLSLAPPRPPSPPNRKTTPLPLSDILEERALH